MRELSIIERCAAQLMRGMTRLSEGYDIGTPLAESMLRVMGARGMATCVKAMNAVLGPLDERYDPFTAQIAIGVSALFNGCRYCTLGHFYSANLLLFDGEGLLGPVDEFELPELMTKRDDELLAHFVEVFAGPRFASTRAVIERRGRVRKSCVGRGCAKNTRRGAHAERARARAAR